MSERPILYGYSPSTYVRTVRMVLADKEVDYDQVSLKVLDGETRLPEYLDWQPFGKVPVLDIDGMRLREADPICRYIDETRGGPSLIPTDARERAKMAEAIDLYNAYGHCTLLGLAAYHLFPDLIGGQNDALRASQFDGARQLLGMLMERADPWIVGGRLTLADYFLGPVVFYVAMTPEADRVLSLPNVGLWWKAMRTHAAFKATVPETWVSSRPVAAGLGAWHQLATVAGWKSDNTKSLAPGRLARRSTAWVRSLRKTSPLECSRR